MDITELTVHELQEKIKNKELTITEITKAYVDRMNEKEKDVQAFITELKDEALKQSEEIQNKIDNGERKRRSYRRFCWNSNRNKRYNMYKRCKNNMCIKNARKLYITL